MGLFKSFILRILSKLGPSRMSVVEKTEIQDMLKDMSAKVQAGTEKVDDQIVKLKRILSNIESAEVERVGSALDDKLLELSRKTGASPEEARKALVDAANEAYPPGSPKTMRIDDNEMLEAYIDTREKMGMKLDLLEDIVDRVDPSPEVQKKIEGLAKARNYKNIFETKDTRVPDLDRAMKANKQEQIDLKALEDKMADIKNFDKMSKPGGIADLMQEVQDAKVIPFKRPDKKAMGGRVEMSTGGIGILKALMSLMRKGDEKQIKNVIRDPKTDLERLKDTDPKQPTIRDMEDLPGKLGYDKTNRMKLEELVEREKVRAILADRMGVEPKDIADSDIDMAIQQGMGMFSEGGGVGSLFKRKAK